MSDPARARRLAKRISTIVASAIEYEIKDPGLAGVTITDAKVTADLHDATLYYTVMGRTLEDEPDYAGAAAALERAKGVLRTKVGAGTGVRFTPTLTFVRDSVPDAANRMEELLERARQADADLARARQGAKPAGDAQPYRVVGDNEESVDEPLARRAERIDEPLARRAERIDEPLARRAEGQTLDDYQDSGDGDRDH